MTIENACASLSSKKGDWNDKKWTKWSNFTLKQQKTTIKIRLIAINSIKRIKNSKLSKPIKKYFKNQSVIKIKTNKKHQKSTKNSKLR
ncbi:hypothetical protein [Salmonella enterica]|uniref:hypothetical protein n=1 Tax=Salmonella enterica TaxID=28901 RepID=UPI001011B971|nr:hypothetical protein [Salmonella enterica]RXN97444.1 hypothetical protein D0448_13750 [Salmonella enterica]